MNSTLDKRTMELAVGEFQGIHNNVLEQLAELQRNIAEIKAELHEERGKRKRAEAKASKFGQQLKSARKNKFDEQWSCTACHVGDISVNFSKRSLMDVGIS